MELGKTPHRQVLSACSQRAKKAETVGGKDYSCQYAGISKHTCVQGSGQTLE